MRNNSYGFYSSKDLMDCEPYESPMNHGIHEETKERFEADCWICKRELNFEKIVKENKGENYATSSNA